MFGRRVLLRASIVFCLCFPFMVVLLDRWTVGVWRFDQGVVL